MSALRVVTVAVVATALFAFAGAASAGLVYLMAPGLLDLDAPLGPRWAMVGHAHDSESECVRVHAERIAKAEEIADHAYTAAAPALRTRVERLKYLSRSGRASALREDDVGLLALTLSWPAHVRRWVCVGANDSRLR